MAKVYIILIAVTLFGVSSAQPVDVYTRGLLDLGAEAVATMAGTVLPEESMKASCNAAGFYNQEKDGGLPRRDKTGGLIDAVGKLVTVPAAIVWPSEAYCTKQGWYNKLKDANGFYYRAY